MSIKKRILTPMLTITFAGLFAALATVGFLIYSEEKVISKIGLSLEVLARVQQVRKAIDESQASVRRIASMEALDGYDADLASFNGSIRRVNRSIHLLTVCVQSTYLKEFVQELADLVADWTKDAKLVVSSGPQTSVPTQDYLNGKAKQLYQLFAKIERSAHKDAQIVSNTATRNAFGTVIWVAAFMFLLIIASTIYALKAARNISTSISYVSRSLRELAGESPA